MTDMIRTAVIGVGHLGQHHARVLDELSQSNLVAIVDTDKERAIEFGERYHCEAFTDYRELEGKVDAVSIAVPTSFHFEVANWAFDQGFHTLIEKPISNSVEEARKLVEKARDKNIVLQIGHIERFNPALRTIHSQLADVAFIESHRLSPFPFRSMDIGVIMDVMIHDLDIILSIVDSEVAAISANATPVLSKKHEDIANARVEFKSGAVANITASRISDKVARKMRMFCKSKYVNLDFAAKQAWIYKKSPKFDDPEFDISKVDASGVGNIISFVFNDLINVSQVEIDEVEPLRAELEHFLECIKSGEVPEVSGEDGLKAIELAHDIMKATQDHNAKYSDTLQ